MLCGFREVSRFVKTTRIHLKQATYLQYTVEIGHFALYPVRLKSISDPFKNIRNETIYQCDSLSILFDNFAFLDVYENIPNEIKQLGKRAVHLYLRALNKGEYVNNLIRCMFVGHFSVGKTTLARGLLQQDIRGIQSTDGIEVTLRKCYLDKETNEWHIQGKFLIIVFFTLCLLAEHCHMKRHASVYHKSSI